MFLQRKILFEIISGISTFSNIFIGTLYKYFIGHIV